MVAASTAAADTDALPSWNDGPAKSAIMEFVQATTDKSSSKFVPPAERIASFDQDGTLFNNDLSISFSTKTEGTSSTVS